MDKYELLVALNDLMRTPKEEEKHLQACANAHLEWMLEAAAEKLAQAPNN